MAGTLNVLGLGSNVLTSDTLDKLKKAETDAQIKPIETKIKNNDTRQSDINTLKGMADELKSLTDFISSESNYLDRDFKTTGDSVSVTVEGGASIESFNLDVTQMATRDIYESKSFATTEGNLTAGDFKITAGDKEYNINVTSDMTLGDLKDKIYDATEGKVSATLLKVGGDEPFKLILKSTKTGEDNAFTVSGSVATDLGYDAGPMQQAQNAKINYNGITITRDSNKFDDLLPGVTIQINDTGKTSVDITQKSSHIVENIEKFVDKYNELLANLQTVTKYDPETKKAGTFQGNSQINGLIRDLKSSLFLNTSAALEDFGIEATRSGDLRLDKNKLENKLKTDFEEVQDFLIGTDDQKGVFENMKNMVDSMTDSNDGTFAVIEDDLDLKGEMLKKNLTSAQERVDSKFEIMQKEFAAYDSLISKMNANFSALKAIIDAQNDSN